MYYKIELFSGCFCNKIDGIQTHGPEFYYSGIIYGSEESSWHTFSDAQKGGIERLRQKLKELSDKHNVSREISATEKLLNRLAELDESRLKGNFCSNNQAEEDSCIFYEKTIFVVI